MKKAEMLEALEAALALTIREIETSSVFEDCSESRDALKEFARSRFEVAKLTNLGLCEDATREEKIQAHIMRTRQRGEEFTQ